MGRCAILRIQPQRSRVDECKTSRLPSQGPEENWEEHIRQNSPQSTLFTVGARLHVESPNVEFLIGIEE